jgi:hypothetical protein
MSQSPESPLARAERLVCGLRALRQQVHQLKQAGEHPLTVPAADDREQRILAMRAEAVALHTELGREVAKTASAWAPKVAAAEKVHDEALWAFQQASATRDMLIAGKHAALDAVERADSVLADVLREVTPRAIEQLIDDVQRARRDRVAQLQALPLADGEAPVRLMSEAINALLSELRGTLEAQADISSDEITSWRRKVSKVLNVTVPTVPSSRIAALK